MLIAAGQIDSIEVAGGNLCRDLVLADERGGRPRDKDRYRGTSGVAEYCQEVYFRLLECGLRIPPTAGSGSGESPNPVGYNRVYAHVDGELSYDKWWQSVRSGQVVVTNGPLLKPSADGELPGHVFAAEEGTKIDIQPAVSVSTREPISYLEIVKDGRVEKGIPFDDYAKSGTLPPIVFDHSGWFLIRVVCDQSRTYRYAMTGPYYVEIGRHRRISRSAAQFFLDWARQREQQIQFADPAQHRAVLQWHAQAQDYWRAVRAKANAD